MKIRGSKKNREALNYVLRMVGEEIPPDSMIYFKTTLEEFANRVHDNCLEMVRNKKELKIFKVNFKGHYLGGALLIASTCKENCLEHVRNRNNLGQTQPKDVELHHIEEIKIEEGTEVFFDDGDY